MYLCIVLAQTIAMLLLLPGGPFSEPAATLHYVAANAALANFVQYDIGGVLDGLRNPGINPSLWTLKIEIGFYLIVPAIIMATQRWGPKVLAAIFVGSVAYAVFLRHRGDVRLAQQLPGQLQFFVTGMALYLYGQTWRVTPWLSAAIAAAFFTAWSLLHPIPDGVRPLLVAAFVHSFALSTPPLRLRTDLSYSVYLIHGPLLQILLLLGVFHATPLWIGGIVILVLTLSCLTERLIERPGTRFGHILSARLARRSAIIVQRA
jgi:peptidoglycan/LPS O-acetylase OafA/YrhL